MLINGKEITTIISDLDGTLLGQGQSLDPAVFSLIHSFLERGVLFVAASGRQYKNMRLLFKPVLAQVPMICENGSLIVEADETIYERNIPRELCFELLSDMFKIPGTETIVSSERNLYTLMERDAFIRYMNGFLKPNISVVKDYHDISGRMNKISIWWKNGIPAKEEKWFHERYDDRLQVVDGGNGWLDFTMAGVNKGVALRELSQLKGFSLEQALCFGDSENDISMFRECAVSYVMETAREHVKPYADYCCADVVKTLQGFLADA
jgi:Cof subfamily protein (haloacid dehalogenase superfamily)